MLVIDMKEKNLKISVLIVLIGIISLVVGVSYAIFTTTENSNKIQIIQSGSVNLEVKELNTLNLANAKALTDSQGWDQGEYYSFTITNSGNALASYTISVIDDTAKTNGLNNLLNINYIRFGLTVNNARQDVKTLTATNRLLYTKTSLPVGETDTYQLRIWLNFGTLSELEIDKLYNYVMHFKLKVDATQIVQ